MNFDDPEALEWELLHVHLGAMAEGRGFDEPVYSFPRHTRTGETKWIAPSEFMIVEGLFVLYWPELRDVLSTKVYVQTDPAVCFDRRLRRDVAERGRAPRNRSTSSMSARCVPVRNGSSIPPASTRTWWSQAKSRW